MSRGGLEKYMNEIYERLASSGEFFAAGFFEDTDRTNFYRFAKANLRYREECALPEYRGEDIYPNGKRSIDNLLVVPHFSYTFFVVDNLPEGGDRELYELCKQVLPKRPTAKMDEEGKLAAGELYVHTNPNFERILAEGLYSYKERIKKAKDKEFREGCLLVMESMELYHARCLEYLRSVGAKAELIKALEKVPFYPAETLYEALVAWNFIYYLDFCDNIGEMDRILHKYHKGEDVIQILRQFYRNVDVNDGWSLRMGPEIYPITRQVLLASKGIRRPLIELCVDDTVPDEIWEIATELVKSGNCNPSFYNYPLYQKALHERFPNIPQCDLDKFTGCGCSETMLSGISRVGSVDAALHLLYLFSGYMRENLAKAESFDEFYSGLMAEILKKAREMYELVDRGYKFKMTEIPHPVRTVLVDDCIDNETDFNAGGARYSWSVVNFPGSVNTLESLLAIRELVFEKKEFTAEEFIELLDNEDEKFYLRLRKCPHFGVNDERADSLAADFYDKVFSSADGFKMCYGEGIITSSVQFITYVRKGKFVASTPDGRRSGEPICDSLAPIMGNDKKSITSTLGSIAKIPLYKALGTPVVNIRLHKDFENELVKPLVEGFFAEGGMQIQITCISKEDMLSAMDEPEKHRDLMVRVGGYTDYFVNLSREAQETIIKRTEYAE